MTESRPCAAGLLVGRVPQLRVPSLGAGVTGKKTSPHPNLDLAVNTAAKRDTSTWRASLVSVGKKAIAYAPVVSGLLSAGDATVTCSPEKRQARSAVVHPIRFTREAVEGRPKCPHPAAAGPRPGFDVGLAVAGEAALGLGIE